MHTICTTHSPSCYISTAMDYLQANPVHGMIIAGALFYGFIYWCIFN